MEPCPALELQASNDTDWRRAFAQASTPAGGSPYDLRVSGFMHAVRANRRLRSLGVIVAAIVVASVVIAVVLWQGPRGRGTLVEQAARLADMGELASAEEIYWSVLQAGQVDPKTLIAFIDNHAEIVDLSRDSDPIDAGRRIQQAVDDAEILELLSRNELRTDVAILGRYWYDVRIRQSAPDSRGVVALTSSARPTRWASHLMGRAALLQDKHADAAKWFEREGLAFPREARVDLEHALHIWASLEEWDEIRARIDDPRYARVVTPSLRVALAEQDRDWPTMLRWIWLAGYEHAEGWTIFLALLSATLWFSIGARMGRTNERVAGRWALYAAAFVLGVFSVYPTLVLISVEERVLGLRLVGNPVADAIYFVFGVGLREELCKLLLFLPLLPLLRRRGSRIEAMTCAALVGLGFAAEENIGYFARMDVSVAIGRFLTANFLHMALTALAGLAAYDGARARPPSVERFGSVFPMVVALHGAYDFLLTSPEFAGLSFLSMAILIVVSQQFLREMMSARAAESEGVLRLFVISLALLSGVSYIYATTLVGPWLGLQIVAIGLLGVAILIYMFVRELSSS